MATKKGPAVKPPVTKDTPMKEKQPARKRRPVRGRPSMYTEELADEIIRRMSNGERITRIVKDEHMPAYSTICDWEDAMVYDEVNKIHTYKFPNFGARLARARKLFAEYQVIEAGDLVDDAAEPILHTRTGKPLKDEQGKVLTRKTHEAIAHARSQANYRQWYAERVFGSRYAAIQKQEITGKNGGPLQSENKNLNANANFDKTELESAVKSLLEKGI